MVFKSAGAEVRTSGHLRKYLLYSYIAFKTHREQFYSTCRSPCAGVLCPRFLCSIFFPFQAVTEPDVNRRAYAGEEQGLHPLLLLTWTYNVAL